MLPRGQQKIVAESDGALVSIGPAAKKLRNARRSRLFAKMYCTGPGELSAYLVEGSIGFSPNASFMNMSSQTASPNSLVGGLKRKVRCAVQAFV